MSRSRLPARADSGIIANAERQICLAAASLLADFQMKENSVGIGDLRTASTAVTRVETPSINDELITCPPAAVTSSAP
ncbi:MAG: hypothetical protein U0Y68_05860 [Blastocatellia bacterium]